MKKLRSGYTTGACAAAAAKAAVQLLITGKPREAVEIPFPDGRRVIFALESAETDGLYAEVAVKKDAGDDPDVTNRALIVAKVQVLQGQLPDTHPEIIITGGQGVGIVTKPGLSVAVGRPAINPVPLKMIREAVLEAVDEQETLDITGGIEVCIMVPKGEELARKTLNKRLGIVGGISILGTTGIVKPVSADAWTATITSSMSVAHASGVEEIILSTGRSSERCVELLLNPPEEALVMMGDYLQFALKEAKKYAFKHIHMAAMWAKLLKGAMRIPQTHVRHGVLEIDQALHFFSQNSVEPAIIERLRGSNTAREILERLLDMNNTKIVDLICELACNYYQEYRPDTGHRPFGSWQWQTPLLTLQQMKASDMTIITIAGISGSAIPAEIRELIRKENAAIVCSSALFDLVKDNDLTQSTGNWISITPIGRCMDLIQGALQRGNVLVLTSGDPLFYGFGRTLLQHFPASRLLFWPALSSMQLCFSRFAVPWDDAVSISLHGRSIAELDMNLHKKKLFILTDKDNSPQNIARHLLSVIGAEEIKNYVMHVGVRLGMQQERLVSGSVEEIAAMSFEQPNCLIVHNQSTKNTYL